MAEGKESEREKNGGENMTEVGNQWVKVYDKMMDDSSAPLTHASSLQQR